MKTKKPIAPEIDRLLKLGWSNRQISTHLRCRTRYVILIRSAGGWEQRKADMLANARSRGVLPMADRAQKQRSDSLRRHAKLIAAVERGMSFTQAAEKFKLPSRSAVAGIIDRYRRWKERGLI